jgi:AraC-like DNA-binding protein
LVLLASGRPVTRVATDLGYSSTSAFIEMFKRHTGRTPGAARHGR